ncbi:MAG: OsmC family protein [Armatimonadia bacterium]
MPEIMTAEAQWQQGLKFQVQTGTGHELVLDVSVEDGGEDAGPRPMEMLLVGNATCMGMDVVHLLKKMRQEMTGYQIRISGERAEDFPKVFTHIRIEHIVEGKVSEEKLAQAIEMSEEKYCSAYAMLGKVAKIETTFTVVKG